MNVFAILLTLTLCLFSCGSAQDKTAATEEEGVRRAEALFTLAYQELDAAVMGRLLTEDFVAEYRGENATKDRRTWLSEIQSYRAIFPEMNVTVDSLTVESDAEGFTVAAVRTFSWSGQGQEGSYQERYRNRWRKDGQDWKVYRSEIESDFTR